MRVCWLPNKAGGISEILAYCDISGHVKSIYNSTIIQLVLSPLFRIRWGVTLNALDSLKYHFSTGRFNIELAYITTQLFLSNLILAAAGT